MASATEAQLQQRIVPGLVVGLLIIGLGLLYGPRLLRGYQFRQSITKMLYSIQAGELNQALAWVDPAQLPQASALCSAALGPDYQTKIQSLKLTNTSWINETTISASIICKLDWEGASPIYQGKLLWHYRNGGWVWDFANSHVGQFVGFEEPTWVKLGEMLTAVESY